MKYVKMKLSVILKTAVEFAKQFRIKSILQPLTFTETIRHCRSQISSSVLDPFCHFFISEFSNKRVFSFFMLKFNIHYFFLNFSSPIEKPVFTSS